jgi:hypothetical protein
MNARISARMISDSRRLALTMRASPATWPLWCARRSSMPLIWLAKESMSVWSSFVSLIPAHGAGFSS